MLKSREWSYIKAINNNNFTYHSVNVSHALSVGNVVADKIPVVRVTQIVPVQLWCWSMEL